MSTKIALMAEHSALMDDVVGAALYLLEIFFMAFAMFEPRNSRGDAAGAIDRGSIFVVKIKPRGCNHVGGRTLSSAAEKFKSCD